MSITITRHGNKLLIAAMILSIVGIGIRIWLPHVRVHDSIKEFLATGGGRIVLSILCATAIALSILAMLVGGGSRKPLVVAVLLCIASVVTIPSARPAPTADDLVDAANNGDLKGIERSLAAGVWIDEQPPAMFGGPPRSTALQAAASEGKLQAVQLLVQRGARVKGVRGENEPLFGAVSGRHLPVVQFLLSKGADPNGPQTINGQTPLYYAVSFGDTKMASALLTAGAHIDVPVFVYAPSNPAAKAQKGTYLHIAAAQRDQAMVKLLLQSGADPNLKDEAGYTPADLAGPGPVAAILRSASSTRPSSTRSAIPTLDAPFPAP